MEVNIKDMVGRFNNARLTEENHLGLWPVVDLRPLISDTRPRLFELDDDWKPIGWCEAPYRSMREYNDAVVFEYVGAEIEEHPESVYWIHCKHGFMNFKMVQATKEQLGD